MVDQTETVAKLFKRIKTDSMISGDYEVLKEYLETLSRQNYEAFKRHGVEMNDIHKGYALCVDFILESFANCDKEQIKTEQDDLAKEAFS
jgi:hypothetical protein